MCVWVNAHVYMCVLECVNTARCPARSDSVCWNVRECSTIMCWGYKNQGGAPIFVTPIRGGGALIFVTCETGNDACVKLTKLTKVV